MQEGYHTRHDSNEGSSQGEWNVSYILEQSRLSDQEQELKNLRKQVKDLEIELRGRCCRRYYKDSSDDPNYTGVESSHGGGSRWSRDRSHETMGCCHESPHYDRHRHHNATLDTMSQVLRRAAHTPFFRQNRAYKNAEAFHPPSIDHLWRKNRSSGTCKSLNLDDVTLFPEWCFEVQGVPVQPWANDNKVV